MPEQESQFNPSDVETNTEPLAINEIAHDAGGADPNLGTEESQEKNEAEKAVMGKVQDIDQYGTAFSSLSFLSRGNEEECAKRFKDVLGKGLLGNTGRGVKYKNADERVADWYQKVRSHDFGRTMVWFNIVGRMKGIFGKHQIDKTPLIGYYDAGVIFDISRYRELPPWRYREMQTEPEKYKAPVSKTFSTDEPRRSLYFVQAVIDKARKTINPTWSQKSTYKPLDHEGFLAPYRISPKFFRGIVIKLLPNHEEDMEKIVSPFIEAMIESYADTPERLLPVYDTKGNLLWPKKMSYEEVKQFVAERDAKKGKEDKK